MTKHHYVYRSYEEWGREYIGVRSCDCLPEEDIKYFGSFRDKTFKPTGKTILFTGETRKEVSEIEIELHDFFDVAVNPQFANMSKATSTGFDRTGVLFTETQKKTLSGKNHPQFGVPRTEMQKKKISEAKSGEKNPGYGKFGALHPSSKSIKVIKPDGTELHFGSGTETTQELKIDKSSLCKLLKTSHVRKWGKFKDYKFVYENP